MEIQKLEMLYEGKAKRIFKTTDRDLYIVEHKDDATAFNGLKKGTICNKGIINNKMSAMIFEILESQGIITHFVSRLNDREMLVKSVEIVPIEVIVRNIAAGSLSKKLGLEEGIKLKTTVLELCYKNDDLGDPMINDSHAFALGLCSSKELDAIKEMAIKINSIMSDFFIQRNLILVDFKLEFGRHNGEIILADEVSPDTCRLWDATTLEKLDKDRFRRDLGNVEEAYQEILKRIMEV